MEWQPMETAPKDGTPILIAWDDGCYWDHEVVWWVRFDINYPWQSNFNAYPEDKPEYWILIPKVTE